MVARLDVAGRLAEGRVAVEHTQRYVRACHALGYEHRDLTSHPYRIRAWYDSEDGLDLRVLDADCAQLRAAGAAAEEASRIQHTQFTELAAAWTGPGSDSALRLLQRHCDAASAVANELRAAAQRCESLRDNLWYLVDSKAATAIAIDDRTLAQRSVWLAAVDTVATGAGDRAMAEDVVRQQIAPYVDNDIRDEWLDTMRSTVSGVAASYDMVIARMAATPAAQFDFPGDLGPGDLGPGDLGPGGPTSPWAASRPAVTPVPAARTAAYAGPPDDPTPTGALPAPTQSPPTPAVPDMGTALGDVPSIPEAGGDPGGLGGGLSGLTGLGGLANRIVASMGDLLGSAADRLSDPSAFEGDASDGDASDGDASDGDASDGDAFDEDAFEPDDGDAKDDVKPDGDAGDPGEPESAAEPQGAEVAAPVSAPPPAEAAPQADEPPAVAPPGGASVPPVKGPPPDPPPGSTPCEIAADALPQAGQ